MVSETNISKDDFKLVVASLKAAYPKEDFINSEYTFNLWYNSLCDIQYTVLRDAAMNYIMTNHYPPSISDIRQIAFDLVSPADELAGEEWARLMKALGYAYAPEGFDKWIRLPDVTKEIVGGFSEFKEWANTPTADLMSVQRPMFIKRFEEKMRTMRMRGSVPNNLQTPMKQLDSEGRPLLEGGRNNNQSGKQMAQQIPVRKDRPFKDRIKDEDYVELPPGVDERLAELRRRLSGVKGS